MGEARGADRVVPFVHVRDVEASLEFYAGLGFRAVKTLGGRDSKAAWAWATTAAPGQEGPRGHGGADLMLARADGAIDAGAQAVLLYMYCEHVRALRDRLLSVGTHDGGVFRGQPGPNGGRCVVFEVATPPHMPAGEIRVHDPDGYVVLVGQLDPL